MKAVLQRVSQAAVSVDGVEIASIGTGILVLLGVEAEDSSEKLTYQVNKLLQFRIFPDEAGKMSRSITDIQGELLVVSQFTLAANCNKGNRPSFENAMAPEQAKALYEQYVDLLRAQLEVSVKTGIFGAMMDVSLTNDGPVTFILEN